MMLNMSTSLMKRIVSAIILAPCFIMAIKFGGMVLGILLFIALLISLSKWF